MFHYNFFLRFFSVLRTSLIFLAGYSGTGNGFYEDQCNRYDNGVPSVAGIGLFHGNADGDIETEHRSGAALLYWAADRKRRL